jgi:3-oxoacyl-[acyl-carrier protein] reductase
MNIDLGTKKALVCGASRGIGRAAARELAALGAAVTLIARDEKTLRTVQASLDARGGQSHHILAADFSNTATLQEKITAHIAAHGPFHILINNSGGPPAGPVHTATPEDFQKIFTQHLLGNHIMMQAALPGMKNAGYGRIINIISTSVKQPIKGLGVSNTIRGAVASWAKTLSGEVAADGITVNNILPGATDTDRMAEIIAGKMARTGRSKEDVTAEEIAAIPAGRFGTPEELAQAIAFLASPAAAYINGINLPVDGGRTGCL